MSSRYWLLILALGGWLTASGVWGQEAEHSPQVQTKSDSAAQAKQTPPEPLSNMALVDPVGDFTAKEIDAAAKQRDYDDLKAQEQMAWAACAMIIVAAVQSIIGFAGLIAIWRSLIHTRDTAQATAEANSDTVALHRPWLFPEFIETAFFVGDERFQTESPAVNYRLANVGATAAFIEEFRDRLVCKRSGELPSPEEYEFEVAPAVASRLISAGKKGGGIGAQSEPADDAIWDNYTSAKGARFYLLLEIKYRDVFDGLTTERFCMKVLPTNRRWERRGPKSINFRRYERQNEERPEKPPYHRRILGWLGVSAT